jgi:hypothetical protein
LQDPDGNPQGSKERVYMKKVLAVSLLSALMLGGYTGLAADSVYELNPVVVMMLAGVMNVAVRYAAG